MSIKYWAKTLNSEAIGPYNSREEAIEAYQFRYPFNTLDIMTGYGNFGPHFDIRWKKVEDTSTKKVDSKIAPMAERN